MKTTQLSFLVLAIAATGAIGWFAGYVLRPKSPRVSNEPLPKTSAEWQARFRERMTGIEIDKPFPDMAVWSPDGSQGYELKELLPNGGIVALLSPGCSRCLEYPVMMQRALDSIGSVGVRSVLLLGDGPNYMEEFSQRISELSIGIPAYCDAESVLRRKHGVEGNLAYFSLDAAGVVRAFGFVIEPELAKFIEILATKSSQSESLKPDSVLLDGQDPTAKTLSPHRSLLANSGRCIEQSH